MKIFLHVGTGKTGTTTIQTFLESNRERLAERGIILPTSLGRQNHRALAAYALNDDIVDNLRKAKKLTTPARVISFRERLERTLADEAAGWPRDGTIAITSEQMIRLIRPGELERLRNLLMRFADEIVVIMYLRRQDEYFVSEYSQHIKGGHTLLLSTDQPVKRSFYDYSILTGRWARVFGEGNLIVRPFEREAFRNGNLIQDFLAILGLYETDAFVPSEDRNLSLDACTTEFLRVLNPQLPRWTDEGRPNLERLRLISDLEAVSGGPKPRLPQAAAASFLAPFEAGNAIVARRFLGREDGRLFQRRPGDEAAILPTLAVEQAVGIALELWRRRDVGAIGADETGTAP